MRTTAITTCFVGCCTVLLLAADASTAANMKAPSTFRQRGSAFLPKTDSSSWPIPLEDDGMVLMHNSIRGELSYLKQAIEVIIQRGTFLKWEISEFQRMWNSHVAHMNSLRNKEEKRLRPLLSKRFPVPETKALDYGVILNHLNRLKTLVDSLSSTASNIQTIQVELKHYGMDLSSYLNEKESLVLPLIRAHFTPSEWSKLLLETSWNDPPQSMGSFIHFQTEQRFRSVFMKQVGIPGVAWISFFRGHYITFQKDFLQANDALQKGVCA